MFCDIFGDDFSESLYLVMNMVQGYTSVPKPEEILSGQLAMKKLNGHILVYIFYKQCNMKSCKKHCQRHNGPRVLTQVISYNFGHKLSPLALTHCL